MGRKILIADDNIPLRKHLQSFLATQGFDAIAVGNGSLAAQRASEMQPELAILDILMPGQTGYEVCRRMKSELKLHTPVILIYEGREPFDRAEAMRVGADRAMQKPLDPFALLDTMNELWREYGRPEFESSASALFAAEQGSPLFLSEADDDFEFLPLISEKVAATDFVSLEPANKNGLNASPTSIASEPGRFSAPVASARNQHATGQRVRRTPQSSPVASKADETS